jgi:hypothetical protein
MDMKSVEIQSMPHEMFRLCNLCKGIWRVSCTGVTSLMIKIEIKIQNKTEDGSSRHVIEQTLVPQNKVQIHPS